MKVNIRSGIMYNEKGDVIAVMAEGIDIGQERELELGAEAINAIKNVVNSAKHGSFKPRQIVKSFEAILEKYS